MTPAAQRIVVLTGLPGCGKSTWAARMQGGTLSSDAIRQLLIDDATDQTIHYRVFLTVRYLLRHRLALGRATTYIDATNLTPEERKPYIDIARAFGAEIESVFFDVPLEVCRERNLRRQRVVPDEAMLKMAEKLVTPSMQEGFTRLTVLRE